jgi:hypothetical protein
VSSNDGSHLEAEHAADHGADADHDSGGGHGHGHDPNEGVLVGTPPTPAWIWTVTLIAAITIAWCVWLAYRIG